MTSGTVEINKSKVPIWSTPRQPHSLVSTLEQYNEEKKIFQYPFKIICFWTNENPLFQMDFKKQSIDTSLHLAVRNFSSYITAYKL